MGCLNSQGQFEKWFANFHLSGACNRACYFCIGQHMMALDSENNLDTWPPPGLDEFIAQCQAKNVSEVNVTGTNTDPLLYKHTAKLKAVLASALPGLRFKIRTNGVKPGPDLALYDSGSVTVCSTNPEIYRAMMGRGEPPDWNKLRPYMEHWVNPKINIVLGPENTVGYTPGQDWNEWLKPRNIYDTIYDIHTATWNWKNGGFRRFNLREPYGQPTIGDPQVGLYPKPLLGMTVRELRALDAPCMDFGHNNSLKVMYWDVHYVEVESVNLYANGRVSVDYPITRGHDPAGTVLDQSNFEHGRHREQWVQIRTKTTHSMPATSENAQ